MDDTHADPGRNRNSLIIYIGRMDEPMLNGPRRELAIPQSICTGERYFSCLTCVSKVKLRFCQHGLSAAWIRERWKPDRHDGSDTISRERIRKSAALLFDDLPNNPQDPDPVPLGPFVVKNGVNSLGYHGRRNSVARIRDAHDETRLSRSQLQAGANRDVQCDRQGRDAAKEFSIRLIRICRISPG